MNERPSAGSGVVGSGVVVGHVDDEATDDPARPFIYIGGRMRFLDELTDSGSLDLIEATSINDSNEIVGTASLDDERHGVLLTPVTV
jgi:hypothetical protein